MGKKKNLTWEQLPQVKEIMESNKPVWIKEHRKHSMWEQCVQEYLKRDDEMWRKKHDPN